MKNCVEGFPECARIVGWFGYKIGQKWGFGFGNEGSDWVALSSEFHAVKGRLPATPTSLKSTTFTLGLENFGINPWCVGSLDNSFGFDWGMDVENGFEGGGKLICQVGCIGCWVCVERGSEDVTFEIVNINGFVGAVLYGWHDMMAMMTWYEWQNLRHGQSIWFQYESMQSKNNLLVQHWWMANVEI